ncbi:MAG: large extracellular alpha-helical protein [Rhodospirillales bacterium]|nr:large extracellular alpha-helical protein [Rhodospirillales bacterium]
MPHARQIVIEFSRPVVPLGRMDRTAEEVGITITPALTCAWRWLGSSSLACNLSESGGLQPATTYKVEVGTKIAASDDGGTLSAPATYSFTTQRPSIEWSSFKTWRGPGSPEIRLVFNQPVSKSSAESHVFLSPVTAPKTHIPLSMRPDDGNREPPVWIPLPGEKSWFSFETVFSRHSDDQKTIISGEEARRVWIAFPSKPLPLDSSFSARIEPGLVSALGSQPGTENRTFVTFDTFPEFRFLGIQCLNNAGNVILVAPDTSPAPANRCDPMAPVSLAFSSPVLRSALKNKLVFTPKLGSKEGDDSSIWAPQDWSRLREPHAKGSLYLVNLPVWLKAAQDYTLKSKPYPKGIFTWFQRLNGKYPDEGIVDEFGRPLKDPLNLNFATDHRRPNFEIIHRAAVLEKNTDSEVPLYVNNLETVTLNYQRVTANESEANLTALRTIPVVPDLQFAIPFGIRDLLNGKPGAAYGFLETQPITHHGEYQRRFFAQVTPWQVHLKLGHFRSIAWVTDLSNGKPVSGVNVGLYDGTLSELATPGILRTSALTGPDGLAVLPGTDILDPQGERVKKWQDSDTRLFLRAERGEDIAILPVSNEFSVDLWSISNGDVYPDTRAQHRHIKAWGLTAQGIYRAGDTIHYKIYVRGQDNRSLVSPPKLHYTLDIRDPMGNSVANIPNIHLSSFGAYSGTFPVPKTAPVGWYDFLLTVDSSSDGQAAQRARIADNTIGDSEEDTSDPDLYTLYPLRVLVSDFTPAPFRVTSEISGTHFQPGETMEMNIGAKLHSGGPYPDSAARLTVELRARPFVPETPLAKNFVFDSFDGDSGAIQILQKDAILDDLGQWKETLVLPEEKIVYGTLSVEGAVQDDRGKSVAAVAKADYAGVDRMVGIRSPQWIYETEKNVALETIVVNAHGAPLSDVPIEALIEHEVVNVAKVKGAGNAYLNETTTEWAEAFRCTLISSATEPVSCAFTPQEGGAYRIRATITDTNKREHKTVLPFWVTGSDYVQWNEQTETALPIIPEKKTYGVGETARYLIKNPWPGAQALITVERYGVIDSFVKTLEGGAPIIEIPVKPDYLPGFYLSVMLFSPRVESPPPETGQIDLGKPAFRMGYVLVPVVDPYKEISVAVNADQPVYRPGETVRIALQATPRNAPETPQPMELAVAVLDESVFDLITGGRSAFDPYTGFNSLDGLDVQNYSLLTRLVGRQKFEKKGANPGGDGGTDIGMRNIFKFVSYWNPSLLTDSQGRAQIEFKVPDNLTGWHILALAVTPGDRMGLGEGTFKVNRPTELRPVMPNQVREGDVFQAGFSVMNRTDATRTIRMEIEASGDLKKGQSLKKTETLTLAPYKRASVFLPLETSLLPLERDHPEGRIAFRATAADSTDSDGLTYTLPVLKSRLPDVGALYGTTTQNHIRESIAFPADIHTDSGDLTLTLSPSVIGNLEGAFRYIRDYPYPCWEQLLTRAVMAAQYKTLKPWLNDHFTWKDSEKLPDEILARATEFQSPGGGMAYFVPQDTYADPYLSAYTALAFTWLRADGYAVPQDVETKLHAYLLTFLRKDVAPDFYQEGMSSTVRAVALEALARSGKIEKADIDRYRPHMPRMDLFGKAHFLMAALHFEGTDTLTHETAAAILSAGNETSGKLVFNQIYDDGYARILASPLRDNCAILSAFSVYEEKPKGKTLIGDKSFRLLRAITQSRGNRDHWNNTQENVFCLNAVADYAKANEAQSPDLHVKASLDAKPLGEASFSAFTDAPVSLIRPIDSQDPGRKTTLSLDRAGQGRLYYAARLRTAPKTPDLTEQNAGLDLRREYSVRKEGGWTLLGADESLKRGDTVRVDLYLSVPAARNFLVVDDPVPAGLEPVNRDLATASGVDASEGDFQAAGGSFWFRYTDWSEYGFSQWSFYHQELRHDSARFYADYLPPGHYHLSYVAQVIAEGHFAALPARAEEMYDPEVYGRSAGGILSVEPENSIPLKE